MSKLTNQTAVKRAALELARSMGRNKCAVGAGFLAFVESETRAAIARRVNHHDNKCGGRKTLR